jgi:hypothetical protein
MFGVEQASGSEGRRCGSEEHASPSGLHFCSAIIRPHCAFARDCLHVLVGCVVTLADFNGIPVPQTSPHLHDSVGLGPAPSTSTQRTAPAPTRHMDTVLYSFKWCVRVAVDMSLAEDVH